MSEGGIGCDTNTIFSAQVNKTGCPIFMMNDNAFTSCGGLSYLTSSRTTIRFRGSWAISTIWLLISDLLTAKAIGCWLRGLRVEIHDIRRGLLEQKIMQDPALRAKISPKTEFKLEDAGSRLQLYKKPDFSGL